MLIDIEKWFMKANDSQYMWSTALVLLTSQTCSANNLYQTKPTSGKTVENGQAIK